MMRRIVSASLRFRYIVLALAIGMVGFGAAQLQQAPVDVFPEFAPPQVQIQTPALGMSASEVETLVTIPMEQALSGVEGLDILRSRSAPQVSAIELIFRPGTDLLHARQLIAERMTAVTANLPTWAGPPFMMQPVSATARVMKIGLSSKDVSLIDMSMTAYWKIRTRLLGVPGVANVPIWGERLKMLQAQVMPERLAKYGVSLEQVMAAVSESLDVGILQFSGGAVIPKGGFIDTPNQRLSIRNVPPIIEPSDLAHVTLVGRDGQQVHLTDVANLVEDHQPLIGDAIINDGPGLMLIIEKFPWANTLDVTRGVEEAMRELQPGLAGIDVDTTIFRPADFIEIALVDLSTALLLGSFLVFLVLLAFLFEWRTALISLVAIPLSLTAAGLVLYMTGATINTMILAGFVIAVGVVVDDAIIDIENITRRLRQHRLEGSGRSTASIILDASLEVRGAIIYATLIDVVALVPVLLMAGLAGAFFRPLAIAYGLAVLASLLVALTVTPALGLILLADTPIERRRSPIADRLRRIYAAALSRIIRSSRPAFALVGVVVLAGVAVVPQLGQSLFPEFKERDFLMHWVTTPGTSRPEEARIVLAASRELRAIPGVRNFGSHIGQALLGEEIVGVEFGENWISIDPKADYEETLAAIEEVAAGYPGMFRSVETYLNERIDEVLSGSSDAIVVRVYGPDLKVLREKSEEIESALANIDGVVGAHRDLLVEVPQIEVTLDLAAARRYGLKPGDIRRAAATIVSGEEVGDIFREGKAYDVQVWSTPESRDSVSDIENMPIDTPNGGTVRLGDVADVSIGSTPNSIIHENLTRRMGVGANVEGRALGSVVADVEKAIAAIDFPLGYHPELIGEFQERQTASDRLMLFGIGSALMILLLLQASFASWRLAFLIFFTLPAALVGGFIAAYLTGGIIQLGSLVGLLTIFGIAARNGIMMINHFQHLERFEGEAFGPALVVRGARERLSPILMTALATGLALVPLALAGDLPGNEIEHPMALVILGGLITSTLLNLFIVPSLYLRFARPIQPESGLSAEPVAATA
jgi:CzcA family heavy metal efflux pump